MCGLEPLTPTVSTIARAARKTRKAVLRRKILNSAAREVAKRIIDCSNVFRIPAKFRQNSQAHPAD
jgi:hypothetical protein